MNYAIFAIVSWVVATVTIAIVGKRSILKQFGKPQKKLRWVSWRAYLFIAMMLGAAVSIGITCLVKSFA
jgi:hypothetical protein